MVIIATRETMKKKKIQEKAETLIHFSYENYLKQLLDIQGFGYPLI